MQASKNPFDKEGISEVDTDKIKKILNFVPLNSVENAIEDLCEAIQAKKIPSSFEKDIYFNVNRLKKIGAKITMKSELRTENLDAGISATSEANSLLSIHITMPQMMAKLNDNITKYVADYNKKLSFIYDPATEMDKIQKNMLVVDENYNISGGYLNWMNVDQGNPKLGDTVNLQDPDVSQTIGGNVEYKIKTPKKLKKKLKN